MLFRSPVGVDQPGLPEAMGEIKLTLAFSTRYALCSERLINTLVPGPILDALMNPMETDDGGTRVTGWWLAQPATKDAKKMLASTILSIYSFDDRFRVGSWIESETSLQLSAAGEVAS